LAYFKKVFLHFSHKLKLGVRKFMVISPQLKSYFSEQRTALKPSAALPPRQAVQWLCGPSGCFAVARSGVVPPFIAPITNKFGVGFTLVLLF
jgi:hypothetical protein